eukprot:1726794-Amphidinium_carterae.1
MEDGNLHLEASPKSWPHAFRPGLAFIQVSSGLTELFVTSYVLLVYSNNSGFTKWLAESISNTRVR